MSFQKNISNQSGIVIDNLQVNQSASIPNQITTIDDYVGVNGIGGSKAFKNNVGFQSGINALGSSTINNLTLTGTFTPPSGSGYVDTSTAQTITGQKTFTSTLLTNQISIQQGYNLNLSSTSTLTNNGTTNLHGTQTNIGIPTNTNALQINSATTIGSGTFPNNLNVYGSTLLGSNNSSSDAINTGLFVGDAKATLTSNISGLIIPSSLVQQTQLPIYSGGYRQIPNGILITVINTASNVFAVGSDLVSMLFQNGQYYIIGVNSGQPQSSGPNKFFTMRGSTSSVQTGLAQTERIQLVSTISGGLASLNLVLTGANTAYAWVYQPNQLVLSTVATNPYPNLAVGNSVYMNNFSGITCIQPATTVSSYAYTNNKWILTIANTAQPYIEIYGVASLSGGTLTTVGYTNNFTNAGTIIQTNKNIPALVLQSQNPYNDTQNTMFAIISNNQDGTGNKTQTMKITQNGAVYCTSLNQAYTPTSTAQGFRATALSTLTSLDGTTTQSYSAIVDELSSQTLSNKTLDYTCVVDGSTIQGNINLSCIPSGYDAGLLTGTISTLQLPPTVIYRNNANFDSVINANSGLIIASGDLRFYTGRLFLPSNQIIDSTTTLVDTSSNQIIAGTKQFDGLVHLTNQLTNDGATTLNTVQVSSLLVQDSLILPPTSITPTMLSQTYLTSVPSTLPATTFSGLLKANNGFTLTTGTLTLPAGSITPSMLSATYLTSVPSVISSSQVFSGTVTFSSTSSVNISQSLTLPSNQVLNSSTTLVDLNSAQTITATKTFSNGLVVSGGALTINSGASETDNGALVVNGLLTANAGIQLPTTAYTPSTNYLGFQPTPTFPQSFVMPSITPSNAGSITLTAGVYLMTGQVDFFAISSTSLVSSNSIVSISSSVALNTAIENGFRFSNTITSGQNFVQQCVGTVSVATTTTYYLIAHINYSAGSVLVRSSASTTTSTTTSATTSSTTVVITASNANIIVGMVITGTGISGTCLVGSISGTTITLTTAQSIPATTTLTFTVSAYTNFTATRIA